MIRIGRISDVGPRYDENWLIVRSLKKAPPAGARQVSLLSPSPRLFEQFCDASKAKEFDAAWFREHYVPTFIRELVSNHDALLLLDQLYRDSFRKDIMLACFCPDETLCHRSIVAGMLLGAGACIECDPAYRKYYDMFVEMASAA